MREALASIGKVVHGALATGALRRLQIAWSTVSLGQYADILIVPLYAYDLGGASGSGTDTAWMY
jgi:hypothetical protein